MTNSATMVAIGKPDLAGGALRAPLGTALPTGTKAGATALDPAFIATGYISSDGVVETTNTDTSNIVAWGGDNVRTVQTTHEVTYALTMIETNKESTGVYYGDDNVASTPATATTGTLLAIEVTSKELGHQVWVFEILDGLKTGRIVLPDAQVTQRGDVSYVDTDAVSYPVTLTAYPDVNGVKAYIYWDDGVFTGAVQEEQPAAA